MSANTAKVTRIFHTRQDTYYKYRNKSECNKILEKEEVKRGFDLLNNKRKHCRAIAFQFSLKVMQHCDLHVLSSLTLLPSSERGMDRKG